MIRKHIFKNKPRPDSIRWRLHEPSRLEAFSDAVMAFAITLVAVTLEVPNTFEALYEIMKGFYAFAICFTLLALLWYEQYMFFRRYGLQDTRTNTLNLALLFMILYFVYPLKFLFTFLTQGNIAHLEDGTVLERFTHDKQVGQLMVIYGIGYLIIYLLFLLMHVHALKKKKELFLSRLEVFNTQTYIYSFLGRIVVVLISLALAYYAIATNKGAYAGISGMMYSLFGVVIPLVHRLRRKKLFKQFSKKEIDEVLNEVVVVEEKN